MLEFIPVISVRLTSPSFAAEFAKLDVECDGHLA